MSENLEIERRFLVDREAAEGLRLEGGRGLRQFYLTDTPDKAIRVRIIDGAEAVQTIKGRKIAGQAREIEFAIPLDKAEALSEFKVGRDVIKTRYVVAGPDGRSWEVDFFEGALDGLVIAEIELDSIDEVVVLPLWIGREITDDGRYANQELALGSEPPPFRQ
jgi:CYTH domain-containing protein